MRPFNLDLWKVGEPVITRDGRSVERLTYLENEAECEFKLMGVIDGDIHSWKVNGKHSKFEKDNDLDLFHPKPDKQLSNMTHEEKIEFMQIASGIVGYVFDRKGLDMLVSLYDLVIEKKGDTDLHTIAKVKCAVEDREKERGEAENPKDNPGGTP